MVQRYVVSAPSGNFDGGIGTRQPELDYCLLLPAAMDLTIAAALRDAALERIGSPGDLILIAAVVERVTTPCIQVLLAAQRSLEENGCALRLVDDNGVLQRAFADLGLDVQYNRWSNPS